MTVAAAIPHHPNGRPGAGLRHRPLPMASRREALVLGGARAALTPPYRANVPGPLVPPEEERSMLDVTLRRLAELQFTRVTLAVGPLAHVVKTSVGEGSRWGLPVRYVDAEHPSDATLPVLELFDDLPEHVLVLNGDTLTDLDYADLLTAHVRSRSPLTVATYQRDHRSGGDATGLTDQRFESFAVAPAPACSVSMAVYAVARDALLPYRAGLAPTFDELMLDLTDRGTPPATYPFDGYWLETGRSGAPSVGAGPRHRGGGRDRRAARRAGHLPASAGPGR